MSFLPKRVVVTGVGMVSPLGSGVALSWARLLACKSGARRIEEFDVEDLPCKIACLLPEGAGALGKWAGLAAVRHSGSFIGYALAASAQALEDAHWTPVSEEERARTGVVIGSGIGGLSNTGDTAVALATRGLRGVSPFFVPGNIINAAAGQVAIAFHLEGPNESTVTACASSAHAVVDAARMIGVGEADVIVAGGAESAICRIGIAGFVACRALTTRFNDTPELASRPFDRDHDGFVMGEGAASLILEEYEHARARGVRMYGEVLGYGLSDDAYHIAAPHKTGRGARTAMLLALERAKLHPQDIDHINAHATSTSLGDDAELQAIDAVFGVAREQGKDILVSATKSSTGHLLGAAGALEVVFCLLAMRDGVAPPTLNLDHPCRPTTVHLVGASPIYRPLRYTLNNSLGFGGTNVATIFGPLND